MNRIKNFKQFSLSEAFDPAMVDLLTRAAQIETSKAENRSEDEEGATGATGANTGTWASKTQAQIDADLEARFGNGPKASDDKLIPPISGAKAFTGGESGDFVLYLQHQQGVAGANGLIRASLGNGKMVEDTIKTKKGVKYANLVGNVPSDRPEDKKNIIKYLDAGDQKSAAATFINMWKGKWKRKYQQAKTEIFKPQHARVKEAIFKYCKKYNVPFDFAVTCALIESGFDPKNGNSTYKGVFAMNPNLKYPGVDATPLGNKWSDPDTNADAGIQLIRNSIIELKNKLGPANWAAINVSDWANNLA
jgi:hypothetical protein